MAKARTVSTNRKTIPIRLEIEGVVEDCCLYEMGGVQRDKWMSQHSKPEKGGGISLDLNKEGTIAELISIHLYEAELKDLDSPDGEGDTIVQSVGDRIPESTVQKFSSSAQMELLSECTDLSGLGKGKEEDESKNEL